MAQERWMLCVGAFLTWVWHKTVGVLLRENHALQRPGTAMVDIHCSEAQAHRGKYNWIFSYILPHMLAQGLILFFRGSLWISLIFMHQKIGRCITESSFPMTGWEKHSNQSRWLAWLQYWFPLWDRKWVLSSFFWILKSRVDYFWNLRKYHNQPFNLEQSLLYLPS